MDFQINMRGAPLGALLVVIATAASNTADAQTPPEFCTKDPNPLFYGNGLMLGKTLAEKFIEEETDEDGLTCEGLDAAAQKFEDFLQAFMLPCQKAGVEDSGRPILDATSCLVVHPGGTFRSDAALEELRGVNVIAGDLIIGDLGFPLDAFQPVVTAAGAEEQAERINSAIRRSFITGAFSLEALESLTTVEGDLVLVNNFNLASLTGLEWLTTVGGRLIMSGASGSNVPRLLGGTSIEALKPELRSRVERF